MEKRFFIAILLTFLIVWSYPYYLQKISKPKETLPSLAIQEPVPQAPEPIPTDQISKISEIAVAPASHENILPWENQLYKIEYSEQSAGIRLLQLKQFKNGEQDGSELIHLRPTELYAFSLREFLGTRGSPEPFIHFNRSSEGGLEREEFEGHVSGGVTVKKIYDFRDADYQFQVLLEWHNPSSETRTLQYEWVIPISWERGDPQEKGSIEVNYVGKEGRREFLGLDKIEKHGFLKEGPLLWVALEKKYFTIIASPDFPLENTRSLVNEGKDSILVVLRSAPETLAPSESKTHTLSVYAGPKSYEILKSFKSGYEDLLKTKVLGGLWLYLLIALRFFEGILHNYGLAIIALSVAMKILFTPLTHMSFESMKKMQELHPKMKAIQEQYKKDPQRMNKEVMELYRRHKINPMSGCFPMFIQMPVFIALYQTLSQAIELRGAPFFGWIRDLSNPDRFFTLPFSVPILGSEINLLPIVMAATMLFQQKITPQSAVSKDQESLMYIMSIVFAFAFYHLPSGLVCYWIVTNLLTIAHLLFIKRRAVLPAK